MQRGLLNFGAGLTLTVNISAVDTECSIIKFFPMSTTPTQNFANMQFSAVFNSETQIKFERAKNGGTYNVINPIIWEIVEYNNVKSIQRGVVDLLSDSTPLWSVTINEVDTNKSIVMVDFTSKMDGANYPPSMVKAGHFTSSTTFDIYGLSHTSSTFSSTAYWTVLEFN